MSLVDDKTQQEVGRFAIEFATLDDLIRILAATVLECEEWEVAQTLVEGHMAGKRLSLLERMSNILAVKYVLTNSIPYKALAQQITVAKEIIEQRNAVIHGELIVKRGKQPFVQLKKMLN